MSAAVEMKVEDETAAIAGDIPALREALIRQREYTLALYADLPSTYWEPAHFPYLPVVNPPLWELAHIAWFAEYFCVRWQRDDIMGLATPSILATADSLFNSQTVPHRQRWRNTYPGKNACFDYMQRSLAAVLDALSASDSADLYPFQLAIAHEDMHAEALAMTLRSLELPFPAAVPQRVHVDHVAGDIAFAGGQYWPGESARSFRFDNEMPQHAALVGPFAIASDVVSAAQFEEFVSSSAYDDERLWSPAGRAWRDGPNAQTPPGRQADNALPAIHVNYHEAEAWCCWAGRRLPTELEWEFAAVRSPAFFASTGRVWEWTASSFAPYPGFVAGRYLEYSEPWFHTHQVLKGGSFVTHRRLKYPQYRNFYTPERRDVFCGFRTCPRA